ncbi:excinuclease ABC subunit B [candidate division TM6 bacterium JCVI TM6SC1]|uniref:Excinuclease ABC subunit B n=1 Tax=candidate division TM6 bacterium JCVI TM6SC1 TaxID=1306947 RepID=A0A0D2GP30_9BACT|nr:excinuclease ABC subunit B [candidate division TM6 bacterium JCVI TM6SC1]
MSTLFKLHAPYKPAGSQPDAIAQLAENRPGVSTLVGVTGSGKTFTMANVIASQNKPVLVLSPNKTLAAQLYEEFSLFFPENKVGYFVSYYDYYQPESYLPAQDVYVAKETKINSEIERLRVDATAALMQRDDVIIVTSVSCIYSLGDPHEYKNLSLPLTVGSRIRRDDIIRRLITIQYERNEVEKRAGTFQVLGNTVEIIMPYQKEKLRIEMFGDIIEGLVLVDRMNNTVVKPLLETVIFPAKHFVTSAKKQETALKTIENELASWWHQLPNPIYQERIQKRVAHDLEMLKEVGYCSGIENYSPHFDGRARGERPYCLLDYFPKDFLLFIDESHVALPQLRGMYAGDRARKKSLIEFGFRLPSAYDNRPLTFEEIETYFNNVIFVSATPGPYELSHSSVIAEQVIRPTGLTDPRIELHSRIGQLDHLVEQINATTDKGYRTLVTVLTKKLAEELARYLEERHIKVCYLHSELKTPARTELLQKLRLGIFDCLVGVNLLREGLDLPEVALVAIMDADIESYLRDKRSLIQIIGRAARNTESLVILYADKMTKSMAEAIAETDRRRTLQEAYNKEHGIVPATVRREVKESITNIQYAIAHASERARAKKRIEHLSRSELESMRTELEINMQAAADRFDFETAIALREQWFAITKQLNTPLKK